MSETVGWVHAPREWRGIDERETAAREAMARFLTETFPMANAKAFRGQWAALGPFALPPLAAVPTHRFGQAFELVLDLLLAARWPEHNLHPPTAIRLLENYAVSEAWGGEEAREAAVRRDTRQVAEVALLSKGIWVDGSSSLPDSASGATTPVIFDAYVADLARLADQAWQVFDDAGLLRRPWIVGVEDLMVDGLLIDVKVYSQRKFSSGWFLDIARRLLDVARFGGLYTTIETVAIYSARHPALLSWPVDDFLATLTGGADRLRLEGEYERLRTDLPPLTFGSWAVRSLVPTRPI
jgi:hypothetical protein